jgi:ABC-type transporter Mla subunit MlaD
MSKFIIGVEAALSLLLQQSEQIQSDVSIIKKAMTSFESAVDLLVDYALALKAENQLLAANDADQEAALAAANARVAETGAALQQAQEEIAADTAEEDRLLGRIGSVISLDTPVEDPAVDPVTDPAPEVEPAA